MNIDYSRFHPAARKWVKQIVEALDTYTGPDEIWIFGSSTRPKDFNRNSDIDIVIYSEINQNICDRELTDIIRRATENFPMHVSIISMTTNTFDLSLQELRKGVRLI